MDMRQNASEVNSIFHILQIVTYPYSKQNEWNAVLHSIQFVIKSKAQIRKYEVVSIEAYVNQSFNVYSQRALDRN